MFQSLSVLGSIRRKGMDDGYFGRPKNPPFQADNLKDAYLAGYQIGKDQRQLEIEDGTHPTLNHGATIKRYRLKKDVA